MEQARVSGLSYNDVLVVRTGDQPIYAGDRVMIYSHGDELFDEDTGESLRVLEIVKGRGVATAWCKSKPCWIDRIIDRILERVGLKRMARLTNFTMLVYQENTGKQAAVMVGDFVKVFERA